MKKFTLWTLFILCLMRGYLVQAQTDVLMQHNNLSRTGWDSTETILNTSNVTPTNFGLLYKHSVDDQIYAQPLVASGININGAPRNVVYVATVKNSVYAFDADNGAANPYWTRNFTPNNKMAPNASDIHASLCQWGYSDFQWRAAGQLGSFGIVGTPVIDKNRQIIYFVSRYRDLNVDNTPQGQNNHLNDPDWSSAGFYQQLNALSLITGHDTLNSPVAIDASTTVNGTGPGSSGGVIAFDPRRENQRGGLVLSNGIVYIPYAGHCDMDNYHGWILGYDASGSMLTQVIRYVTTPNDERGGIWMSGAAPAVDAGGNLYFASGNANNASLAGSPDNVGLSVVKVSPNIAGHKLDNVSWFKPLSYTTYNTSDLDFGTGVVLIPGTNMLLTAHKSGNLMLMNQTIPLPGGEYNEGSSNFLGSFDLGQGGGAQSHSALAYFGGSSTKYVYQFSEYTHLSAYPVLTANPWLGPPVINTTIPTNTGMNGGFMSVSSKGKDPSSAILWVTHISTSGGALNALKADDVTQELWNSDANSNDVLGFYAKMNCVTIANGKVYAPTFANSLNVYGLLAGNTRCLTNVALHKTATASSNSGILHLPDSAFDGKATTDWGAFQAPPQYISVDLGQRYDICKVRILWVDFDNNHYGVDFEIDISDDGITWTPLNIVLDNAFTVAPYINEYNENASARYVRLNVSEASSGYPIGIKEMEVYGSPASNCIPPPVGSLTATNITQNSATLSWNPVPGAVNYIVRYKTGTVSSYVTRIVPGSTNPLNLTINALTCGFNYEFDVQTDCGSGQVSLPSIKTFNTLPCSSPCTNLTRFSHGDLGDIQAAGMSCYNDPTFTVSGAGTGLGGNGDQFQFNYTSLNKDEEFIMRLASQSPAGPGNLNQAGILMRDSVTDISRFIFIGRTGDNNLSYIYRSTVGGLAVSTTAGNPGNASFFRIVKAGTQYSAFYGISTTGPWAQMGTTRDLGFGAGTNTIYIGMAVSSLNPTATSTATFDNLLENATALPIQLLNFTATNMQDQYVSLKWQTGMEENNDHFEIERSTDGSKFTNIITVKAVGNSSITQSYNAIDNSPANGINFYRLKQVDLDNRFTYSPIKIVKFGTGVAPLVYPNPVNSLFTAVPGSELIREIVIYNIQGRAVQFALGNSNQEDMKVNVSSLAAGIYILKIKTDLKVYQYKIVKE